MKGTRDFIAPAKTTKVIANCTRRERLLALRVLVIVALAAQKCSMSIRVVAK